MKGDKLVLVGYISIIAIIVALALIALSEGSRLAFFIWNSLLILLVLLPALSRLVPKFTLGFLKRLAKLFKRFGFKDTAKYLSQVDLKPKPAIKQETKSSGKKTEEQTVSGVNKIIKIFERKPEEEIVKPLKVKKGPLEVVELNKPKKAAETKANTVKTEFDQVIDYVKENDGITMGNLTAHFKLPREKIEEWVKILADHGLLELTYPMFGDAKIKIKKEEKNE